MYRGVQGPLGDCKVSIEKRGRLQRIIFAHFLSAVMCFYSKIDSSPFLIINLPMNKRKIWDNKVP